MAEARPQRHALVLAGEQWHQGVVGIVASRLAEKYSCPAFMICLQDGKGKGSCRSFAGFNLFAALERCAPLLEGFGGHALAAGFTIREENIPAFAAAMNDYVCACTGGEEMVSALDIDGELDDVGLLTLEGVEGLELLEPYGAGNPKPVFSLSGCLVSAVNEVGGGRHLKLKLTASGRSFDAIFFSATAEEAGVGPGDRVDVAFTPQINEYRGWRSVQLQLCDLRPALTRAQAERALYEKFRRGSPHPAGGGGPAAQPGGVRHPVALPEGPRGAGPAGGHGPPPGPQHRPLRRPAGDGDAHPGVPGGL